jgi:hypothetical protein
MTTAPGVIEHLQHFQSSRNWGRDSNALMRSIHDDHVPDNSDGYRMSYNLL